MQEAVEIDFKDDAAETQGRGCLRGEPQRVPPRGISISPPQRPAFANGKGGGYQKERQAMPVSLFGDPAGIRTPDPLLKRQLLCQLSYRIAFLKNARGREELAGTAGLEPADEGVKVPCLTTWLRPYVESGNRG